ncbi:MAG: precorrin-2 C(20)-methyltransferase, partial [Eubacteriaceae bacterium]|nr:precorrin-2 C(20)-methyltransferase [Eubacteriaceae bacterium]
MKGIFYGVGIGPGDSSLMTLKAVRLIEKSGNIAFPGEVPGETLAYRIVTGEIDLSGKELMGLSFPMSNDKEYVASCHRANADRVCAVLEEGADVVLPVLGDPGVYSTFSYVADLVKERGYETRIIPGITSFCAA